RIDGSTAFGSSKKYSPFWSFGLGWNLHSESFFDIRWINTMRLRANIGEIGNHNFSNVSSVSVYKYETDLLPYGRGIRLETYGNPNLEWQNTLETSLGLDLVLFDSNLSANINAYRKLTNPLI